MSLDTAQALDRFLSSVEKRAYRIALIASSNHEDALDLVQDAMLKLANKYADRGEDEWGPLFHRILQSTIRDWYRRQKVRNQWRTVLEYTKQGFFNRPAHDGGEGNPEYQTANLIDLFEDPNGIDPNTDLVNERTFDALDIALNKLPHRQQQAFLLRAWEGLSVEETANAMGCTQGSVKTHYSRAVHTLRKKLENHRE